METSLSPLLPAFNLLWKAALRENSKRTAHDSKGNTNSVVSKQRPYIPGTQVNSLKLRNQIKLSNEESTEPNSNATNEESTEPNSNVINEESVVVCTLECDHGAKFVRQIIHEGTQKSEWSRAEDLFIDWLNSELTSQHAQRIDVTIYFCHIPVNTCSHGLCLWLQNLRQEGKEVKVKIKVASLGSLVSRYVNGDSNAAHRRQYDHHEVEETIAALKKLANLDVVVEPLSGEDWTKLMTLLTDRTSLQVLDLQHIPSAESLAKILHNDL